METVFGGVVRCARPALLGLLLGLTTGGSAGRAETGGSAAPDPSSWPSGPEIAKKINARPEGDQLSRSIQITLTNGRGGERVEGTRSFRKQFGAERKLVLFYESPANLAGTALLTRDYPEAGRNDDQWIYTPADRKPRRIASKLRGQEFQGTDFTYEDLSRDTRVNADDYSFKTIGFEPVEGRPCYVIESVPVDAATAKQLGYGRLVSHVDSEIWFVRQIEYFDVSGNPLKTFRAKDVRQVQGIWTAHRLEMENHKSGHRTVFEASAVDYQKALADDLFEQGKLERGPR